MYKPIILQLAKQDIKEAANWYNNRQTGLGKKFTTHLRETIAYLCGNPKIIAIRYDNIRAVLLDTFPYLIHFYVDDNKKTIVILAVLHTARDPKTTKNR